MKASMKTVVAATALALFGLTPAIGTACDYYDATSASATPIEQMAAASTPAASKVPAATVAKTPAPNAVKQVAVKVKPPSDQKLAAGTTN
ncbi:MAG TPA: hypothetical protein VGL25_05625 [Casimicrobiaceae bacterium]